MVIVLLVDILPLINAVANVENSPSNLKCLNITRGISHQDGDHVVLCPWADRIKDFLG